MFVVLFQVLIRGKDNYFQYYKAIIVHLYSLTFMSLVVFNRLLPRS